MKKVLSVIVITILLFITSCNCGWNYKYYIQSNGTTYFTNEVTKLENGCIVFLENENKVEICGNYIIEINNDYVPEKKNKNKR